jgi:hypothetical protein
LLHRYVCTEPSQSLMDLIKTTHWSELQFKPGFVSAVVIKVFVVPVKEVLVVVVVLY